MAFAGRSRSVSDVLSVDDGDADVGNSNRSMEGVRLVDSSRKQRIEMRVTRGGVASKAVLMNRFAYEAE